MLFTEEWVENLRRELVGFVSSFTEQSEEPMLKKLIKNYDSELRELYEKQQDELNLLKRNKDTATAKLIESQAKWTNFAKDILAISKGLLKAINTLQANKVIPQEFLQLSSDRIQKYDAFLNESNLAFSNGLIETSIVQEQSVQRHESNRFKTLDYSGIKAYLKTSKDEEKVCLLLQALRMRFIRAHNPKRTKQMINDLIISDLLDCNNPNNDLLKKLLKHHNKEYIIKTL